MALASVQTHNSKKEQPKVTVILRFVEERSGGRTGHPVEVSLAPYLPWDEACRRLRSALRRVAIIRCSDGQLGWREICNAATYSEFRESIAQKFGSNSDSVTLEAHIIPIGSGALPLWTSEEASLIAIAGAGGQLADKVLRERMLLTRCIDRAIAGGGSGSEAEKKEAREARRLVDLAEAAAAVGISAQQDEV